MESSDKQRLFLESHRALMNIVSMTVSQRINSSFTESPTSMNYASGVSYAAMSDPLAPTYVRHSDGHTEAVRRGSQPLIGQETLHCIIGAFLESHRKLQ